MSGVLALVAGWTFLAVLAVVVLAAVGLAARRILLGRTGGTVECGLRHAETAAWRLGLAAYQPEQLHWFSAFGVRLRPDEIFDRRSLSVLARRPAEQAEVVSIGVGTVVVECGTGQPDAAAAGRGPTPLTVELAMSEAALTGFLAWLESAPPAGYLGGLS